MEKAFRKEEASKKKPKIAGAMEKAFRKEEASKKKPKIAGGKGKALGEEDEDSYAIQLLEGFSGAFPKKTMETIRRVRRNEEAFKRQNKQENKQDVKNLSLSEYKDYLKEHMKQMAIRNNIYLRRSPRLAYTPPPLLSQEDEQKMICNLQREVRSHVAFSCLTQDYNFVKGIKCCISSGFQYVTSTGEYCFDSSWAAVHGFHTICMVTCRDSLDTTPPLGPYLRDCLHFPKAVISEVECIPYHGSMYKHENLRKRCIGKVVKPFGVVSLVQTTDKSVDEAIDPVIKFLDQEIMKDSRLAFNDYKTLETAIGAYKCMFPGQVLKAEDISVTIMDVSGGVTSGVVDHLDIDIIREELEIINGGCSRTDYRSLMLRNRLPLRESSNASKFA